MTAEILFDNFNLLAEAPNGVDKLRGLILRLAVQRHLVEHDSHDEPASVLLVKINEEKKRYRWKCPTCSEFGNSKRNYYRIAPIE